MSGKIITSSSVGSNTGLDATTQPSTTSTGSSQEVSDGSAPVASTSRSSSSGSSASTSYDAKAADEALAQAVYELGLPIQDNRIEESGGLGTYLRTIKAYSPLGTTADASNILALLAAMAGVGEVRLLSGTAVLSTPLDFSGLSNSLLVCHPNTVLQSTMVNGTGQTNSPLLSTNTFGALVAVSVNTTLGSTRIDVANTATFPVGTIISVGSGNRWAYYTVKARSVASGAGYLTTERPLLWQFLSASDSVCPVTSSTRGLHIYGNGATISGTGDRAIELSGVQDGVCEDFRIDATAGFGGIVVSADIGSLRFRFKDIHIVGGYGAQAGHALESTESCSITGGSVIKAAVGAGQPGYSLLDNMAARVTGVAASLNTVGLEFNYGSGVGVGTQRSVVSDSVFTSNTSHGVAVLNGSKEVQIESTQCRWNGGNGVYLTNNATGVQLVAVNASDNTGNGVQVVAGSSCSVVNGVMKNNGQCGVDTGGDFIALGCDVANNLVSVGFQITGTANAQILGCKIAARSDATYSDCIMMSSTGTLIADGNTFDLSGGGTKVAIEHNASGVVIEDNNRIVGAGLHGYYTVTATAKLRRGQNSDFSAATTPYTTQVANFGSATLVGGTVTVANTLVKTTSRIKLTKRAAGGTEGHVRISAITADTSFVITSSEAADTSTFEWEF